MRNLAVLPLAAVGVFAFAACGSDDDTSDTPDGMASVLTTVDTAIEEAKLMAFVAAFRTGYSELAEGRSDEDIERIVTSSCSQLAAGADKETVTVEIEILAANDGTKPSSDQADSIYNLVAPACP